MVRLNGVEVGTIGFGLMGLTWRPRPVSTTQALATMKTAVTSGAVLWNGGTFYGPPSANSLHLLNAYFTAYPEDADKVVVSVKGPIAGDQVSVRRTVDECLRVLNGTKHLDIFQCARVDPKTPIEETIGVLAQCIAEGKLSGISLSEARPEMIRRAAAVHKIACVEVEFSLFATEILHDGVAKMCAELGIPIVAYSPLGRGFLTTNIQRGDTLDEGDVRKPFPRIQPGNFEHNLRLAEAVADVARRKRCPVAQLALAWVRYHGTLPGFPEVIPIPGATTVERVRENSGGESVELTRAEFDELNGLIEKFEIVGTRYP